MKKLIAIILSVITVAAVFSSCTKNDLYAGYVPPEKYAQDSITTVTFNCAAPWGNLLDGTSSSARVKRFAEYMNKVSADLIGTQEMNSDWLEKLSESMSGYESYGVKRGGDETEKKSEMNAIFWKKDKFSAIEKGTFWLSQTPDKESRYDGAGCNRICTWALLENAETGNTILFMNTHLDNASEEAANYGAEVIKKQIAQLEGKYSFDATVLTGDFNQTQGMAAYETIESVLNDSLTSFEDKKAGTYQSWGEEENTEPIDFIFLSDNATAVNYEVLNDISEGYVSDHYGVYTEWSINE